MAAILHQTNQPVQQAGREMIVLELYRRGTISSGKAGELLGMQRIDFIQHASRLGIPYFALTTDEWEDEMASLESSRLSSSPTPVPASRSSFTPIG